jgi:hypothetical protein
MDVCSAMGVGANRGLGDAEREVVVDFDHGAANVGCMHCVWSCNDAGSMQKRVYIGGSALKVLSNHGSETDETISAFIIEVISPLMVATGLDVSIT